VPRSNWERGSVGLGKGVTKWTPGCPSVGGHQPRGGAVVSSRAIGNNEHGTCSRIGEKEEGQRKSLSKDTKRDDCGGAGVGEKGPIKQSAACVGKKRPNTSFELYSKG